MGNTQLPFHQRFAFVDPAQEGVAEVERPAAVGDFLKTDPMCPQGGRQVQQPGLEANGAGIGHALHDEMVWIFEGGERAGIGAGTAAPPTARSRRPDRSPRPATR